MIVGVLGGGQLGRMLALAGYPLGLQFRFLDPAPDAPAGQLAELMVGAYDNAALLEQFVCGVDVVTYEFENVPVATVQMLGRHVPIYPPPKALEVAQDRLTEKQFFQGLGIPTPPFAPVDTFIDLTAAIAVIGLPAVLKTRRFGYDGKGQVIVRTAEDVAEAWAKLGGAGLIVEGFIPFERELSILAVRSRSGATVFYPLVENSHRDGILRRSIAPALGLQHSLQEQAETYSASILCELDYVGVLAVEFFETGGTLIANEMAPRVHNSGHWSIEGAVTSQFENHLRAVLDLPLGSPAVEGYAAMVNLIGTAPEPAMVLALPDAHLHLYGKEPRPNRKLGHITLCAADRPTLDARLAQLQSSLPS